MNDEGNGLVKDNRNAEYSTCMLRIESWLPLRFGEFYSNMSWEFYINMRPLSKFHFLDVIMSAIHFRDSLDQFGEVMVTYISYIRVWQPFLGTRTRLTAFILRLLRVWQPFLKTLLGISRASSVVPELTPLAMTSGSSLYRYFVCLVFYSTSNRKEAA